MKKSQVYGHWASFVVGIVTYVCLVAEYVVLGEVSMSLRGLSVVWGYIASLGAGSLGGLFSGLTTRESIKEAQRCVSVRTAPPTLLVG